MLRRALGAASLAALLATPLLAAADPSEVTTVTDPGSDRMTWSSDHPVAIGTRTGVWDQGYVEPGLGGQIRFQPWSVIGIEGFSDNFATVRSGALKRDFVNGFNLFFPLTRNRSWSVSPQFGVCDEFQWVSPFGANATGPSVVDVLLGLHAGVQVEARFGGGLAVEAALDGYGYVGHSAAVDSWTASLSDSLSGHFVAVSTVGLNYYF